MGRPYVTLVSFGMTLPVALSASSVSSNSHPQPVVFPQLEHV